jgi:hypothetical protein
MYRPLHFAKAGTIELAVPFIIPLGLLVTVLLPFSGKISCYSSKNV